MEATGNWAEWQEGTEGGFYFKDFEVSGVMFRDETLQSDFKRQIGEASKGNLCFISDFSSPRATTKTLFAVVII